MEATPIYILIILCFFLLAVSFPDQREPYLNMLIVFFESSCCTSHTRMGTFDSRHWLSSDLMEYTAGIITIDKLDHQLKLRINKEWRKVGGLVMFMPNQSDLQKTARQWKWLVAGEALLSLLAGTITLIIGLQVESYTGFLLVMLGFLNCTIFAITIVPSSKGGYSSDGPVIRLLNRGGLAAESYMCTILLTPHLFTSTSPAEWPQDLLHQAKSILRPSLVNLTIPHLKSQISLHMNSKDVPKYVGTESLYVTHCVLWGDPSTYEAIQVRADKLKLHEPYSRYRT